MMIMNDDADEGLGSQHWLMLLLSLRRR